MRRELSKSGLGMFIRPLVMILCQFMCLSKRVKKRGGGPKKKRHNFHEGEVVSKDLPFFFAQEI